MSFPSTLTAYTQTTAGSKLNNPSHSGLHDTVSSALGQVEAVIGVDGDNSVLGTIIGDLRSPGSGGGGHIQTANKGGTGQTAFTKGDLLVAQSSSVISKLSIGLDTQVLVADSTATTGVKWGNPALDVQSFVATSSSFIWRKPSVASQVLVQLWGGGGSGGTANGNNVAGGGGGGAYVSMFFPASNLGTTEIVTIGAGGTSVTGMNSAGNNGGTTTFGSTTSYISATGGGGGGFGAPPSVYGGLGGVIYNMAWARPIFGEPSPPSSAASAGLYSGGGGSATGGIGGDCVWGGAGGGGVRSSIKGAGGKAYGGGGNGGDANYATSAASGQTPGGGGGACHSSTAGSGGSGKAIITTFG